MNITVIIDLPDKDMNAMWVHRKAQELKRMSDFHLRQDFHGGHDEANTTMTVEVTVKV